MSFHMFMDMLPLLQVQEVSDVSTLLKAYQWLVCYLLSITEEKVAALVASGKDPFTAKNESQVFFARTLSIAFIEVR